MVAGYRAQDSLDSSPVPPQARAPTLSRALHADCRFSSSVTEAYTRQSQDPWFPGQETARAAGAESDIDHSSSISTTILELNTLAK